MSGGSWWKRKPKPKPVATTSASSTSSPIRVTEDSDGPILNRSYSYWPTVWNKGEDIWYAFVGHADGHPRFFKIEGTAITRLGPLIPFTGGEGWYWDLAGWVTLCDGPRLMRVNPFTGEQTILMDISASHPGCRLWQAHSAEYGRAHSATVERPTASGPYERLGTVVQRGDAQMFFPAIGVLDESQIDASGDWLVIKEGDDNRIVNLVTGNERIISNTDGALGHSDCGIGYAVGEDDQAGACVVLEFATLHRRHLFDTWRMGVVSVRDGKWLLSDATKFNISLIAPDGTLTVLHHHGIDASSDYDRQVRASLSPDGSVCSYVADGVFYVLRVP